MELLTFCRTRGLPTDELGLCITPCLNEATSRVEQIGVDLLFSPSFPGQYVEPCLRAVSQCSVKEHLEAPLSVIVTTTRID
jgi:ribosomal protein S12 methylthiotransferase accessory factor